MKIKEFIKYLEKLDQEKDIWISYDCDYYVWEPDAFSVSEEDRVNTSNLQEKVIIKKGDYVFNAS